MIYRPEVDGLRAIAVLPVLFYHAGYSYFSGGFVGVDVFFVISGYLITTIVYEEMLDRRFSIWRFYERRARRILPALFTVTLVCIPFAYFWMLPHEFKSFSQSLVGVATFTSNFGFWREAGYFADPNELKPLLHTWSLAVEEQFYVLFPPVLLLLHRFCQRCIFLLISLGVLASLFLAHWGSSAHPSANFYLLPTRVWELGIGALVALYLKPASNARSKGQDRWFNAADSVSKSSSIVVNPCQQNYPVSLRPLREVMGLLGLALIVYAIVVFDKTTPFPSLWGLIPTLGTALILLAADRHTLVGRFLSLRLLVGVGLVSYSAYLWHQPLFAFARIRMLEGVQSEGYLFLIIITFGLAWVTWQTIERPMRWRGSKLSSASILATAALSCSALVIIGLSGSLRDDWGYREAVISAIQGRSDISPVRVNCHATGDRTIVPSKACIFGVAPELGGQTDLYIWGDSHGVELSFAIGEEINTQNLRGTVFQFTASQCIPVPQVLSSREIHCPTYNDRVFNYLVEQADPGIVVLVARWPLYFIGERVSHSNGCIEGDDFAGRYLSHPNETNRIIKLAEKIQQTIDRLKNVGHKVVLIHAVPEPGCNVPLTQARAKLLSVSLNDNYSAEIHLARRLIVFDALGGDSSSYFQYDPTDIFCDTDALICVTTLDSQSLYFDSNHPSLFASKMIARRLVRELSSLGWLKIRMDDETFNYRN